MTELSEIKQKYKELSNERLIQLWKERDTLRPDVIPFLKTELISRGCKQDVLKYDKPTVPTIEKSDYINLSHEQIQDIVFKRLQIGESIDSIRADLAEGGVNLIEQYNIVQDQKEEVYELISSSMESGKDVNKKLKNEYDLGEADIEEVKNEMWSRAKVYMYLGIGLISISCIMIFKGLNDELLFERSFNKVSVSLLCGGIYLLRTGLKQRKK